MEFIRSLHNLREHHCDCVATIGNFDGFHRGHQAIIRQVQEIAKRNNLPTAVVTFEPQPQEYFSPGNAPARIMRLREKIENLRLLNIDRMVCLRFDQSLANLSAEQFVQILLVQGLAVQHLVVGDDFRFGKDRQGDIALLQAMGQRYGFEVLPTVTCQKDGQRISSTWLREALAEGDLDLAEQLLGKHYFMSGRIVHGDKRGRELGFPTINIDLHRLHSPVSGIFVSRVHGLGGKAIDAVVSIGTRPMFGGKKMMLEAHLLDFNETVYGQYVRVELLKQLRKECMFDSIDELKKQMQNDVTYARKVLNSP